MGSIIERKTPGPAGLAQAFILGEKLGVNRAHDDRPQTARIRIVDDDPVMHSCSRGVCGLPCGRRRRSCAEAERPRQTGG
jgi:hypothetical protein